MFLEPVDVHLTEPVLRIGETPHWRIRSYVAGEPYRYDYRVCSFCGCIHPGDLQALVDAGARIEPSTKGYKAYVRAPNPIAGTDVTIGTYADGTRIRGTAPQEIQQKIYWDHFTPEQRQNLLRR